MNECVVSCRYDKMYPRVCHSYTWFKKKNPIKAKGLNFSSKFQKARYLRAEGEKQLTLTSDTRIEESRWPLPLTPHGCKETKDPEIPKLVCLRKTANLSRMHLPSTLSLPLATKTYKPKACGLFS